MSYKATITTNTHQDGKIEQTVAYPDPLTEAVDRYTQTIIDTQDEQAREALITLGWTPPEDGKSKSDEPEPSALKPKPGDILSEPQALRWAADNLDAGRKPGEGLEWWDAHCEFWGSSDYLLATDVLNHAIYDSLRVAAPKQRTVTIDGAEYPVPEPMKQKPGIGHQYWFVEHGEIVGHIWGGGDNIDHERWRQVRRHYATREEAKQERDIHRAIYGRRE